MARRLGAETREMGKRRGLDLLELCEPTKAWLRTRHSGKAMWPWSIDGFYWLALVRGWRSEWRRVVR